MSIVGRRVDQRPQKNFSGRSVIAHHGPSASADTGAVTLIQRFASATNLNIHLHCLVFDGVYRRTEAGYCARPALAQPVKCVHISRLGLIQGAKYPRERGKFSSNTVRLTVCRTGDIVADSEKGHLNFLFADGGERIADPGRHALHQRGPQSQDRLRMPSSRQTRPNRGG